ncbi:carbamoyltransferase C-terminal domain-containing protein [Mucilaginibacter sp. L3T2-6]|uniref:carbamoyltransferase family protein n=1 Tax=Mucilaginibacter sp. L3T2-6 TaxID=3062491 RepID=UPI0026769F27|nr:carbamoyltransferase C-terminal domain-containing protein [Mucilaginibacter sp. L3T2-6]MDO3642261.1 carbamoyltransferase C-terminal domain-containing protein [Mucilaginibacter sp. L3T2-6]MDV6214756.1 carbamoyltransferase C-terminal domain-containing protein [Mucilaginibacter sp. L3T2-6]
MSVYILGTGLSHDGSACILKDGKIIVAIEKERLSRVKHDGGNDYLAVKYCLDAAGIGINDLSLIVQAANFEIDIQPDRYSGARYFEKDVAVPIITLSHHMAHAWGAAASSPFVECNVMVIDGAGSPYQQCCDINGAILPDYPFQNALFCEKDSYYYFNGKTLQPLFKDFSEVRLFENSPTLKLPTNYHSIGGLYSAASFYAFGNMEDAGKLMGLAPYGKLDGKPGLFKLEDGIVEVIYENVNALFTNPATGYEQFKINFNHYADIARWVQDETEKAILYIFEQRLNINSHCNLSYAGGVALNAVANCKLLLSGKVKNLYMQPSAGDNGLSIGCAYYGWHEMFANVKQDDPGGCPFLGRPYLEQEIEEAIKDYQTEVGFTLNANKSEDTITETAALLAEGNIVGWFRGGAEFGPRALGHRSILADARIPGIRQRINRDIKFREDFRPFAPVVKMEDAAEYFIYGWESPYMILVDRIKQKWATKLQGIVHEDGTCRVQTVTRIWNNDFYDLIDRFARETGMGVLLNTSLNKRGMPIVETPLQAIRLFFSGAMDVLVIDDFIIRKPTL